MRIEVRSLDRIGISQEILGKVAELGLNIKAMEVATGVTYLYLGETSYDFDVITTTLRQVDGVIECKQIELLPTESREQHLNALLKRLPDPIFDIDDQGLVISCNYQSHIYVGKHIESLLNIPFENLKAQTLFAIEIAFEDKTYHAEVSPLWVEGRFNGAVIILNSLNRIGRQLAMLQAGNEANTTDDIIGNTKRIHELKLQIVKFSTLDLPVLLTGETGTGKELVARAIHQHSDRSSKPFLAINCASLSEQLLESELFGYDAGAFTGANTQGKAGLFELAQGGTVFLDEVAEMSVYLQAKLLRFLQDYSYRRVGGSKELTANVRIISASHQSMPKLIQESSFREDLYYRLNVLNISLPPLRERVEDIALLTQYFIEKASMQVNMLVPEISSSAVAKLSIYHWPGNIRQLQNVLFRLVALYGENGIQAEDVDVILAEFEGEHTHEKKSSNWLSCQSWQDAQELFEQELLAQFQPLFPTTRKLADRLKVSHNKIAMKLRKYKP